MVTPSSSLSLAFFFSFSSSPLLLFSSLPKASSPPSHLVVGGQAIRRRCTAPLHFFSLKINSATTQKSFSNPSVHQIHKSTARMPSASLQPSSSNSSLPQPQQSISSLPQSHQQNIHHHKTTAGHQIHPSPSSATTKLIHSQIHRDSPPSPASTQNQTLLLLALFLNRSNRRPHLHGIPFLSRQHRASSLYSAVCSTESAILEFPNCAAHISTGIPVPLLVGQAVRRQIRNRSGHLSLQLRRRQVSSTDPA